MQEEKKTLKVGTGGTSLGKACLGKDDVWFGEIITWSGIMP